MKQAGHSQEVVMPSEGLCTTMLALAETDFS